MNYRKPLADETGLTKKERHKTNLTEGINYTEMKRGHESRYNWNVAVQNWDLFIHSWMYILIHHVLLFPIQVSCRYSKQLVKTAREVCFSKRPGRWRPRK